MTSLHLPKVSIRIPSYNHEDYIEECLESILEDTYKNKEVVIIDDGSQDNTPTIIENWIKKNKRHIDINYTHRKNKGLTSTLNELIEKCRGSHLVSLASDDFLLKNSITPRVKYLEKHKEKLAVFGDCIVVDTNSKVLNNSGLFGLYRSKKEKLKSDSGMIDEIITNWGIPGPVLMVKKEIYKKIGRYDENLEIEDWDLYIKMASKNLLGFIDHSVSAYRLHSKNSKDSLLWSHEQRLKTAYKNIKTVPFKHKPKIIKQSIYYFYLKMTTKK